MNTRLFPKPRPNNRQHVTFTVYVPRREGTKFSIAKGSGIVGRPHEIIPGTTMLDYEGNLYGAENLRTYGERVMHAASRAVEQYPTVARMGLHTETLKENFVEIGTYDYHHDRIDVTDAAAQALLDAWLA